MRKKILRVAAALLLALGGAFLLTASSVPGEGSTPAAVAEDAKVENPGTLEQFGPPGVLISTILGGVLLIVKNINEGKRIDVTTYKERAAESESRANTEIGKWQRKLEDFEKRFDNVVADRDNLRSTLEDKKANFSQQLLDAERRHQEDIISTHAALTKQLSVRYELEKILVKHGIHVEIIDDSVREL